MVPTALPMLSKKKYAFDRVKTMNTSFRKKNLLFVTYNLSGDGGSEKVLVTLLNNLNKDKYNISLFLMQSAEDKMEHFLHDKINVIYSYPIASYKQWKIIRYIRKLLPLARNHDVIIGAKDGISTYIACLCGKLTRKPVIGWSHGIMNQWFTKMSKKIIVNLFNPFLAKIVCVSNASAESMQEFLFVKKDKIEVIYNPMIVKLLRLTHSKNCQVNIENCFICQR